MLCLFNEIRAAKVSEFDRILLKIQAIFYYKIAFVKWLRFAQNGSAKRMN